MMKRSALPLWTCSRCLRAQQLRGTRSASFKTTERSHQSFSTTATVRDDRPTPPTPSPGKENGENEAGTTKEPGALSRRLAEMAEETMDTGSKSDRKLMQDAGFSEDLKKQLEERIAQSAFAAQHQQAMSQVTLPV
jgi:hypothetical protein